MKIKVSKTLLLLIASVIAMVGLVIFQVIWMQHSRNQLEKTFDQQVCMAVCSAIESMGATPVCQEKAAHCSSAVESSSATNDQDCCGILPGELAYDPIFHAQLKHALAFHQIDLQFEIKENFKQAALLQKDLNTHLFKIPDNLDNITPGSLEIVFPGKPGYLLGKLKWMIGATILIILFIAAVLLFANWMLLRQKLLLETNKDYFNHMAHEFRTPLSNINLALQLIRKKNQALFSDNLVQTIQKENDKLRNQVESILQMAQFENGGIQLKNEIVNIFELTESVKEELKLAAESNNITIDISNVSEDFLLNGDAPHLQKALRNLVENAIKYAGAGSTIVINTACKDNILTLQVQDNGKGIDLEDKERIFKPFQRAQTSDQETINGFGLGLAYVKKIIALHNGKVWVESQAGKGCNFFIQLERHVKVKSEKIYAEENITG